MKYLKLFENCELSDEIQSYLKDICLDINFIDDKYSCHFHFNDLIPYIYIHNSKNIGFDVHIFEEILERIKYYMYLNNYKCKISYINLENSYSNKKSNIFYDNKWNPKARGIYIKFYKKFNSSY